MQQKFLDQEGLKVLWSKISMEDYPNNETLMAVIEAIDETKITAPSSAEIGQILAVKHINENGVPIEWECVDNSQETNNNIELDSTLTQSGKAADAKAVGDALLEAANNTHEHSNKEVLDQISSTVDIYTTAIAPVDAEDGSIWIDAGSNTDGPSIYVRKNGTWAMSSDGKSQKQSDWNEVDGASAAYIRNKPFGYMEDVFANSNMPFTLFQNSIYYSSISYDIFDSVVTGDEITVVWDGVPYNVTAKQIVVNVGGETTMTVSNAIGNSKIAADAWANSSGDDSGEPFIILPGLSRIFTKSTLATHSVIVKFKDNVVKIDPKFLPDEFATHEYVQEQIEAIPDVDISGLATVEYVDEQISAVGGMQNQIQADWNETDGTAAGYVRNKPFGYKSDLYANSNLQFALYNNDIYGANIDVGTLRDKMLEGDNVNVIWDGTTYNVIAKSVECTFGTSPVKISPFIGNGRIFTDAIGSQVDADNSGEPFAIVPGIGAIYTRSTREAHSLVIKDDDIIVKLDVKFLPDEALLVPVQPDWNETDENSYAFIKNKPASFGTYEHPETHPASMITGLANVAISGSYNDLSDKPAIPSIEGFATKAYVDEKIASINVSGSGPENVILETQKVDGFMYMDAVGLYGKGNIGWFDLESGKEYRVAWDGEVFTCKAYEIAMNGYNAVVLGNEAYAKGESSTTVEPFSIYRVQANGYCCIGSFDTETSHEVGIYEAEDSSSVSVQANWDQVDETAADFIKNKPFGEYKGLVDILQYTTYDGFGLNSDYGVYAYPWYYTYDLIVGETYIVRWDDVDYTCVAQDAGALMNGAVVIGNLSNFGLSGNNEPFIIAVISGDGVMYASLTDTEEGNSHSISIAQKSILIKKIDKEYLPDASWNNLTDKPFYEYDSVNTLLSKTVFNDFFFDSTYGCYMYDDLEHPVSLTLGQEYRVSWDGTEYICTARDGSALAANCTYLGNGTPFGFEGNNEPFIIASMQYIGNIYLSLTDTSSMSHEISIAEDIIAYKTIDKQFIPIPFFGSEKSIIVDAIFQSPVSDSDPNAQNGELVYYDNSDATLLVGQTYTVIWDNIRYELECFGYAGALPTLGNSAIIDEQGEDNGIPFIITRDISGALLGVPAWIAAISDVTSATGQSHCRIEGELLTKIDKKYLYQPDWNEFDPNSGNYINNKPFGEIPANTPLFKGYFITGSISCNDYEGVAILGTADWINLISNNTQYNVIINETTYIGNSTVYYGQNSIEVFDDNGFILRIACDGSVCAIMTSAERIPNGTECNITVSPANDIIQKIDAKFLPDGIGGSGLLPTPTSSDAGKFLRVDSNGQWILETIPNATEVSF